LSISAQLKVAESKAVQLSVVPAVDEEEDEEDEEAPQPTNASTDNPVTVASIIFFMNKLQKDWM
jgi:hypothetical protein